MRFSAFTWPTCKDTTFPGCTSQSSDEQLCPFRGRCSFIQYIPTKPAKYGLKVFWICDAETYYPLNCIIYTGATSWIPTQPGQSQGHSVVMQLALPYLNKGRNITMDNFFTYLELSKKLLQHKTTLVGTVRRNKPFCLQDFKEKKHLKKTDSCGNWTKT